MVKCQKVEKRGCFKAASAVILAVLKTAMLNGVTFPVPGCGNSQKLV